MESFRDDKLGFYAIVLKYKDTVWVRAKDLCISLGYKDYKTAVQRNVSKENKKKSNCQDKRYLCYFLNKNGVN